MGSLIAALLFPLLTISFWLISDLIRNGRRETEDTLRRFLERPRQRHLAILAAKIVMDTFDRLFGSPRRLRFFISSFLTSISCVSILFTSWCLLYPKESKEYFAGEDGILLGLLVIAAVAVVFNVMADILGMLSTWFITRKIRSYTLTKKSGYLIQSILWLLVDFVLTSGVAFGVLFVYSILNGKPALELLLTAIRFEPLTATGYSWGIFFYSTFLTSAWLWVCFCSSLVVCMAGKLDFIMGVIARWYNPEKPFQTLRSCMIIVFVFPLLYVSPEIFIKFIK